MQVRKIALANFSEKKIPVGMPLATLEEVLVPVYLFHRYQVEAAAKVLAGVDYTFALRGDGQKPLEVVNAAEQRRALSSLLATIRPEALVLPEKILSLIPPRPFGFNENPRETFKDRTGLTFDPMGPPEAAANMTLRFILHPERAARLVNQHALNNQMPGLAEVTDQIMSVTWKNGNRSGYAGEIARLTDRLALQHLTALAADKKAAGQVRAVATLKIGELKSWLTVKSKTEADPAQKAHFLLALSQIKEFEENPEGVDIAVPQPIPAGAPIGTTECEWVE
jgi:hypothetical protein